MIQIDDAGSGSLIGGTGIGILDTRNNKYYFEIIPLEYYQTELFYQKAYQDYVVDIIKRGFKKINVTKDREIEVCQGYMFDKLRDWLSKNDYNWKSTKIEGPLQHKVEESFNQYVINLGLPKAFIKHARYAFGFHRLLKWVFADLDNRQKLCKTQWKSWQKWGHIEKSIYKNTLTYQDYCLKCGKKIDINLDVITIEYITNKPATINLHKSCYKGQLNQVPPIFLHDLCLMIKVRKKIITKLNPKSNQNLYLKTKENKVNILDNRGEILGSLNNKLGEKLAFWLNKGFNWHCILKDFSDNNFLVLAQIKNL
ncbi:MAG: hypothetical protein PWQ67_2416 [Clostridia bacterium]|jgi:hypothetical protein|nr:hypothetical protein [Clostridia bacterium]MDN5323962.1 hypothetical protein [Clostridia bacterium]